MALVCLCYGVNDRRIRREIASGATSIAEISARCSAGGNCHGCHDTLDDLIDEHLDAVCPTGVPVGIRFA